ncbi:D-Ala-D-Ala carboxypeptidase family metallohydrolase [Mesoterricola sediminis]|uniref:Peptidase M15A C-terminal domain-containing protein n=1 Tax=Mesoterricola sediminis TaxID=2927980 RepID=A0AA48KDF9_9BACT|nr:D-Ala-D-Ala carboxypeptidase family metallohydrolase [Mesoterricola sediminis]BDU76282.1 hypothetical protein METESE_12400 [Mesoterricola sediminis]
MTSLTAHFTLEEMTRSEVASRRGIINTPNQDQAENLEYLCMTLLEPIRNMLGCPLHVNSGFRSHVVNLLVGGASNSAHLDGRACDFVPVGMDIRLAFDAIRRSALPYDKVLLECGSWIHVQIAPKGAQPRRQAYLATGGPGAWEYQEVRGA